MPVGVAAQVSEAVPRLYPGKRADADNHSVASETNLFRRSCRMARIKDPTGQLTRHHLVAQSETGLEDSFGGREDVVAGPIDLHQPAHACVSKGCWPFEQAQGVKQAWQALLHHLQTFYIANRMASEFAAHEVDAAALRG